MDKILLLGKGISNNALNQFMIKYSIEHDYLELDEVKDFKYTLVVKGPGIFYDNEVINKFLSLNIDIITDIEFIYWFLNKEYIGVTGTNGKTTTTYLITDILNMKFKAISCGNCGFPISQAALDYKLYKYFVVELSSFQLKGIKKFAPKIAVVTNVKQAHLDYHKSLEDYYKSKMNITKNQTKDDYLVLNIDDEMSIILFKNSEATKITYSLKDRNANCYFYKGRFYYNDKYVCNINHLSNKTDTFKYDVLASLCVAKLLGIENKLIVKALKNFVNIRYRLEEIQPNIFNDAKSTNIYSTISALMEFKNKKVLLICGGYDRKDDFSINENDFKNVKRVYAYGKTKDKLFYSFKKIKIEVLIFETLSEATLKALNDRFDETILYSPMFASYDQYSSFEQRGKEFNKVIYKYFNIL